jgi:hypothetical protein
MSCWTTARLTLCTTILVTVFAGTHADAISTGPLPSQLAGTWRITRILPTRNTPCWSPEQAQPLVGSTLTYNSRSLRWQGGQEPLEGITTRVLTATQFRKENTGGNGAAEFIQLGIHSPSVLEVDLQHEDAEITGATTEVPGDSILLAAPGRIIVSACGVFYEATRPGSRPAH